MRPGNSGIGRAAVLTTSTWSGDFDAEDSHVSTLVPQAQSDSLLASRPTNTWLGYQGLVIVLD